VQGLGSVHEPQMPSREFLVEVMSPVYLLKLCYSIYVSKCVEVPLFFLPAWFLRTQVLNPMMMAATGSVKAMQIALEKHSWAINLAGGYHHATRCSGGGFCIYPDITFMVHFARKWYGIKRVFIVDLDAHQGNGHERDWTGDQDVHIMDVYNHHIYPGDTVALEGIKTEIKVTSNTSDEEYLRKVAQKLD